MKDRDLSDVCFCSMLEAYGDCDDQDKVDVVLSLDHILHEIRNHPDRAIQSIAKYKEKLIAELEEDNICPECGSAFEYQSFSELQPYGEDCVEEKHYKRFCPVCGYEPEDDE